MKLVRGAVRGMTHYWYGDTEPTLCECGGELELFANSPPEPDVYYRCKKCGEYVVWIVRF